LSGVVAANPGSYPELGHAAEALAGAGMLDRYHLPLALSKRSEERLARAPGIASPLVRQLRRRALASSELSEKVRLTGLGSELARLAADRLGVSGQVGQRIWLAHLARFDRLVAGGLDAGDAAILTVAASARRTLERASSLGITSILDCPLSHHRSLQEEMRAEAVRQPAWATTLQGHDQPESALGAYERELELADVLLTLSAQARDTFIERGIPEAKVIVATPGVDLELFRPLPRVDDGTFRVIFVGQITQRKGISYLAEGFAEAAIPNSELLLVGAAIGGSAPWDSLPFVRHIPTVPRVELPALYARADVFALPSLAEGFGLTGTEAMACAKPVILSTATFGADIVTDGVDGFVVPVRDKGAIAERLRLLAADPDLRASMGAAARARVERFGWESYGERMVEICRLIQ
jgi:starch synthase